MPTSMLHYHTDFTHMNPPTSRRLIHFHLVVAFAWIAVVCAMLPPPPVQCGVAGCIIRNAYGVWGDRKDCHSGNVTYPTTEEELRRAVAYAVMNDLKVKVVTRFSHTIPKLVCPAGSGDASLLISTEKYSAGVVVDVNKMVVTAEAGVALRRVIDEVEARGLSLVAAPYWEGVSVGGVISTGAHGSSWWGNGGAVHDHVVGMRVVVPATGSEGYAKVVEFGPQDQLINAAKLSLGLLGVISKVKLGLEKGFKRSITYNFTDDGEVENLFLEHAKKYEFGDITWYPSRHTAVYRYDIRVPLDTPGDGVNDFLGFQANPILVSKSVRASEKSLESTKFSKGKCALAASFVGYKKLIGNGLKNNGVLFTGYPVIGRQGKMQTSGSCLYSTAIDASCAWDPRINGLFFYETTAIFAPSNFRDFIVDVKKLRDLKPEGFCGVDSYNGFMIRYIKASQAYLGQSQDSVVVDFNYYRADNASTPRLDQDLFEEVEQMAFFKYGARPHWAKNRLVAFSGVQRKYPGFSKFLAAKQQLDPWNMFSSEWSDQVLFGQEAARTDGCALEGQCVCSEDRHCSPSKGYFCRPGLVYLKARVCRYSSPSNV